MNWWSSRWPKRRPPTVNFEAAFPDGRRHVNAQTRSSPLQSPSYLAGERLLKHGDVISAGGSETTFVFHEPITGPQTLKVSTVEPAPPREGVYVDIRSREVYLDGVLLDPPLPRKEFDLLSLMHARRGEAISRDEIALKVWSEREEGDVGNHEIEQCVHRVRARIEKDTSSPEHLVTIRGFGYRFG